MSPSAMWFALIFVIIAVLLSVWQRLKLEKEIMISAVRSAVQLILIGYVLQFVFHGNQPGLILLMIAVMIGVASWNATQRGKGIKGVFWRIAITLFATEGFTMAVLVGLNIVEGTPQYVIPLSGMIIGSSMIVAGLFLTHMIREVETSRGEIETLLCLGATRKQAIHQVVQRCVKSSMIPTFDTMKTIGLVQLPGAMTGMIIAGASPVEAVRFQVIIMFSFSSAAAITAIMLAMLSYPLWFTEDGMLRS
ncbi:ABC transporter permease [Brevibacillus sp. H7]|uniref:ABC transporter permease n=1 Tax=Brevibacillus sp. H7 TaxID=3349138 RepID=UPI0037F452C3